MRPAISDALLPARARFQASITEKRMALAAFQADFNRGGDAAIALTGILDIAHKIAGVAETLGFPAAGQLAAALDRSASAALERPDRAAAHWSGIESQLAVLMDELESIQKV